MTCTSQNNNIEKVRIAQQANLPKEELAQLVMTVIDQLIADCRYVCYLYCMSQLLPTTQFGQQICIKCIQDAATASWQSQKQRCCHQRQRLMHRQIGQVRPDDRSVDRSGGGGGIEMGTYWRVENQGTQPIQPLSHDAWFLRS